MKKTTTSPSITTELLSFLPPWALTENKDNRSEVDVDLSEDNSGSLAAVVVGYDPSLQMIQLSVSRQLHVQSKQPLSFTMQASAYKGDLLSGRRIAAHKLASVSMSYTKGPSKSFEFKPTDLLHLFEKENNPNKENQPSSTNETQPSSAPTPPNPQLTNEAKKRLFLEWIIKMFDELF